MVEKGEPVNEAEKGHPSRPQTSVNNQNTTGTRGLGLNRSIKRPTKGKRLQNRASDSENPLQTISCLENGKRSRRSNKGGKEAEETVGPYYIQNEGSSSKTIHQRKRVGEHREEKGLKVQENA